MENPGSWLPGSSWQSPRGHPSQILLLHQDLEAPVRLRALPAARNFSPCIDGISNYRPSARWMEGPEPGLPDALPPS